MIITEAFVLKKQENKELSLNSSSGLKGNIRYYLVVGEWSRDALGMCSG